MDVFGDKTSIIGLDEAGYLFYIALLRAKKYDIGRENACF